MIKRILFNIFVCGILMLEYFLLSITISPRNYIILSLAYSVLILIYIVYKQIKQVKNSKESVKPIERIISLVLVIAILLGKYSIDHRNLQILKGSNKNLSVQKLLRESIETSKNIERYESKFNTDKHEDIIIYYTKDFEPALKLVDVYLDTAKQNNLKLFGNAPIGELTVKFDYEEEVFKKRNPIFNDFAGLYNRKDRTAYVYIKDCYSNALAWNLKSVYLRETLMHEYTHHSIFEFLSLNQIPENKLPAWFGEGISDYVGYEGGSGYPPTKMVAFSELLTQEQWADYNNQGYSVYNQSHYAVRQLIALKGERVIKDIILKLKNKDFNTAFKEAAGISFKDYEQALNEDFKNDWKKYNKINLQETYNPYRDIKIECLEKYININPQNIDALLDFASFYEGSGNLDKERSTLMAATERGPDNTTAWHRTTLFYERIRDFDNAVKGIP